MPKLIISYSGLMIFCWALITMFLTRQFPLSFVSFIGNLALWGLFFLYIPKLKKGQFVDIKVIAVFVAVLLSYAILMGNQISWIIRFAIIVFSILYAYFIKLPQKSVLKWLVIFVVIQCFVLIITEMALMFFIPKVGQVAVRQFFLTTEWGDVYSYDGFFFRVQIKGSAIIPFVYCLSWVVDIVKTKWKWGVRAILLLGLIIAGNFAFILGVLVFHLGWFVISIRTKLQLVNRVIIGVVLLAALTAPIYKYTYDTMERKSGESTETRIDQTEGLFYDLQETPITHLFGQGLGNSINYVSQYRDYTKMQYFELQALYFLNQMGLIGFAIFVLINLFLTNKYIDGKFYFVYFCYVLYAAINPYILDTTHIVVIITLIACSNKFDNEKDNLHPRII